MNLAINGRMLCILKLPMMEEANSELSKDEGDDDDANNLMVRLEAHGLR